MVRLNGISNEKFTYHFNHGKSDAEVTNILALFLLVLSLGERATQPIDVSTTSL